MNLAREARVQLRVTVEVDTDPAAAVVTLKVDGTFYPCTWEAAAVQFETGKWRRSALTDGQFAGPDHPAPGGAVVLALGDHRTRTKVDYGANEPVVFSGTITVS